MSSHFNEQKTATIAATLSLVTIGWNATVSLAQLPSGTREANPQLGCLSGYPDGSFRGDRAVTRNEFAAGLNACLEQVEQLLDTPRENRATQADVEALIERQRQLNEQLQELSDRVSDSPANK